MANEQLISEIVSNQANEQVERLTNQLKDANSEMQDTIVAARTLNNVLSQTQGMNNYNQTLNQSRLQQERLNQAQLRTQMLQQRLTQQTQREAEAQQRRNRQTAESARAYTQLDQRHKELLKRAQDLGVQFGTNSRQFRAAAAEANKLDKQLKAIDASLGRTNRNVGNYKEGFKGAISEIASFATAGLSVGSALKYVFDSTRELAGIRTSLAFILNSDGAAANKLDELKVQANLTGQEFFTLAKTYKSFIGAAIASNFNLEEAERIFKSVTVAAGRLGLSSEQTEGALLALQQMISKGNVQAEELRGQLGERLPGAFSLAAKAMGVTEKELNKLLQTGQVTAADMLPKLATQLDKTFGLKAGESIEGLNAEIGRLMTQLQVFAGESSSLSKNIFEPIIRGARELLKELNNYTRGSFFENLGFFATLSTSSRNNQLKAYDLRDSKNRSNNQISGFPTDYSGKNQKELGTEASLLAQGYRDAIKAYNSFSDGIKSGELKDRGNELNQYAAIVNRFAEQIKKVNAARKTAPLGGSNKTETPDDQLTAIKEIQKRISELSALPSSAVEGSVINNRIDKLKARLKELSGVVGKEIYKSNEAIYKAQIKQLDEAKAYYEEGYENQQFSLDARLEQLKNYSDIAIEQARLEGEKEKAAKKLTSNEILAIEADVQSKQFKIRNDAANKVVEITRQAQKRIADAIAEQNQKDLTSIDAQRDKELSKLNEDFGNGLVTQQEYEQRKYKIEQEYTDKYIALQIKQTEAFIKGQIARGEDVGDAEARLYELKLKYSNMILDRDKYEQEQLQKGADDTAEYRERIAKKREERFEQEKQIGQELFDFGNTLLKRSSELRLNTLQAESDQVNNKRNFDIEQVNDSIATEEEKADKIAIINARADAQQQVIDQRVRQEKIKQAKADKAAAIAQAIINGALAMTKVAAQTGILTFAFSPLVAALTAIQVAAIVAQPIPQYKHGKNKGNKYAGPAIVGDGGMPELIIEPNGRMSVTPSVPTLTNVGRDTQVISGPEFKRMLAKPNTNGFNSDKGLDISPLLRDNNKQTSKIVNALKSQTSFNSSITEKGFRAGKVRADKNSNWYNNNFR